MFFVIPQELRKPVCLHSPTSTTRSKTCCINTHLHARPKALTFYNMYTHRLEREETTSMLLTTHMRSVRKQNVFFGLFFLGGGVWGVWVVVHLLRNRQHSKFSHDIMTISLPSVWENMFKLCEPEYRSQSSSALPGRWQVDGLLTCEKQSFNSTLATYVRPCILLMSLMCFCQSRRL